MNIHFSKGAAIFEGPFNRSIKIMAGCLTQHRYLMGPLEGTKHRIKLMGKYLGFIKRIKKSPLLFLRQLYMLARSAIRTVTGSNLRSILLFTDKLQVDNIMHYIIEDKDLWTISLVMELYDMKHADILLPEGMSVDNKHGN